MSKKFTSALRKDLTVRRTGLLGLGRKIEVSAGGLTYRIDRRAANEDAANYLNSKMPAGTIVPPMT